MSPDLKKLKEEYDQVSAEILDLYQKQNEIGVAMKQVCTHENIQESINQDPLIEFGYIEVEKRYKCQDCFTYIKQSELEVSK